MRGSATQVTLEDHERTGCEEIIRPGRGHPPFGGDLLSSFDARADKTTGVGAPPSLSTSIVKPAATIKFSNSETDR